MVHAIALSLIKGLGCTHLRVMVEQLGSPEAIFALSKKELSLALPRHPEVVEAIVSRSTMARAEEELAFCQQHHVRPLFFTDKDYPQRLNLPNAEDTPPLIYTMCNANLNAERVVAVVGTRHATAYGRDRVRTLLEALRDEQVLIVSGLAYGIDTEAHTQSLANHLPTVGVVAHGFDQLYPAANRNLAKQMVQGDGALVTEYPSRTRIHPSYFPARNRIVAAISDAVIVIESARKGGSLITADLACGYHREVFAFPGRVGDKYSEGTNKIIFSNKAALIQSADDLLSSLNWTRRHPLPGTQQSLFDQLPDDEAIVRDILINQDSLLMEDLLSQTDLSLPQLSAALLSLELKGRLQTLPGKRYRWLP